MQFQYDGDSIDVDLRLSRARNLNSGFRIRCEHAIISLEVNERFEILVTPDDGDSFVMRPANVDVTASWYEPYRAEIDDWLTAIRTGKKPKLSGQSCLPTMAVIDACYAQRTPMNWPWLPSVHSSLNENKPRVLITGAGGFIGCRTAELLAESGAWKIRGHVRRPASASRLARLDIELMQGDLRSDADVTTMVRDCQAVVHCAVGTDYGQPRSIYDVTVRGTRRLIEKAREHGVQRFVHISSIGVHDPDEDRVIDERTPLQMSRKDWYGYTKGLAEQAVQQAAGPGAAQRDLAAGMRVRPVRIHVCDESIAVLA